VLPAGSSMPVTRRTDKRIQNSAKLNSAVRINVTNVAVCHTRAQHALSTSNLLPNFPEL